MAFASAYIGRKRLFPEIIKEKPDDTTGIIVVIPSYNETRISGLLDSLALCTAPECSTEVIIVVNAPADASGESIENNKRTISDVESWKRRNRGCFFRLFLLSPDTSSFGNWGVGHARKTGMDEAVSRFSSIDNPEGVILSLDADCTVEKTYFVAVYDELLKRKERIACSIYFEHPLAGDEYSKEIYDHIAMYELHLRYFLRGIAYSGYPYPFHTVGSAFAVKALPYLKAGGMNRRQAGEDFYFIQKMASLNGYFNLTTTTVYPSPRASARVPFGTGAVVKELSEGKSGKLFSYNVNVFKELRSFFGMVDEFYYCRQESLNDCYKKLPVSVRSFIGGDEWIKRINEIRDNTSSLISFRKRFFRWFNMFRIVKYLNTAHTGMFEKKPVNISASELPGIIDHGVSTGNTRELLYLFREMDKE